MNTIKTWLANKWNEIVESAKSAWGWVKERIIQPIRDAWNWLQTTWNNIKAWLGTKWNDIANTARTVWNWVYNNIVSPIKKAWDWLISTWNSITTWLSSTWNNISSTASRIWRGIGNAVIGFVNGIISAINGMIRGLNRININVPNWVPLLGGKSLGFNLRTIGYIPYLAQGGIITSPTLAMIGEAGAEAVVPLERNTGWIDELARKIAASVQSVQPAGAGIGDIYVYIGNEQIDAYIYRSQDRRNIRSNGR